MKRVICVLRPDHARTVVGDRVTAVDTLGTAQESFLGPNPRVRFRQDADLLERFVAPDPLVDARLILPRVDHCVTQIRCRAKEFQSFLQSTPELGTWVRLVLGGYKR